MELDGKVAVVTGSTRGVGRATALDLARGGCSVVINYSRSKEEAEGVANEVEALGGKAMVYQANIADDAAEFAVGGDDLHRAVVAAVGGERRCVVENENLIARCSER